MKLVLFDIDGTLVHSNGVGSAATKRAMLEVFGTLGTLADFRFGGKTDWQMLLETLNGLVLPDEIEQRLAHYDDVLAHHITQIIPDYHVRPCIGAFDLLQRTLSTVNLTVGLLTANMPQTAFIKLRTAGYDPTVFQVNTFGSDAITREALAPIALSRAHQLTRYEFPPSDVIIIGDTPDDIACARSIGARVISVATGRHTLDELAFHQPDILVENLMDAEAVLSFIVGDLGFTRL